MFILMILLNAVCVCVCVCVCTCVHAHVLRVRRLYVWSDSPRCESAAFMHCDGLCLCVHYYYLCLSRRVMCVCVYVCSAVDLSILLWLIL